MKMKMVHALLKEMGGISSKSAPKMLTFTLIYKKEGGTNTELSKEFKFREDAHCGAFKPKVSAMFFLFIADKKTKPIRATRANEGDAVNTRATVHSSSLSPMSSLHPATSFTRTPVTVRSNSKEAVVEEDE